MAKKTSTRLKRLHNDQSLVESKLVKFRKLSTDVIIESLRTDGPGRLRIKPDGTIMEGNHRVKVLEEREYPIDSLFECAEIVKLP